jgi:hypothetical protein
MLDINFFKKEKKKKDFLKSFVYKLFNKIPL